MESTFDIVKDLKERIDKFLATSIGEEIIQYYFSRFNIPPEVSSQYIKQKLALNYSVKNNSYLPILKLPYLLISVIKYLIFILITFTFSKRHLPNQKKFTLIIDDLHEEHELSRWEALEKKFNTEKTLYVARFSPPFQRQNQNIFFQKNFFSYSRKQILNKLLSHLFSDLFYLIKLSLLSKLNLVHIHSHFSNDYLYYKTLFKICHADFLIQDRNLGRTNALKNYLFKESGGVATSCVQKNIVQHNGDGLFYDIDIFFSYGDKTAEDILDLGGRINEVHPVGSFAMRNAQLRRNTTFTEDLDILYIGINAVTSSRTDWTSYYESVEWLVEFAKKNKEKKIFIKHHPSWKEDDIELELLKDSGVKYLNKEFDTYEASYKSSSIVTYGSSMGYELLGKGCNVLFLDPNQDNPYINRFVKNYDNVIYRYDDMERLLLSPDRLQIMNESIEAGHFCVNNLKVEQEIHKNLLSYPLHKMHQPYE